MCMGNNAADDTDESLHVLIPRVHGLVGVLCGWDWEAASTFAAVTGNYLSRPTPGKLKARSSSSALRSRRIRIGRLLLPLVRMQVLPRPRALVAAAVAHSDHEVGSEVLFS
jgi:hypothetical protein